jgi:hypothetical protein
MYAAGMSTTLVLSRPDISRVACVGRLGELSVLQHYL